MRGFIAIVNLEVKVVANADLTIVLSTSHLQLVLSSLVFCDIDMEVEDE